MPQGRISIDRKLAEELRSSEEESHIFALYPKGSDDGQIEEAIQGVLHGYREEAGSSSYVGRFPGGWTWTRQANAITFNVLDPDGPLEVLSDFADRLATLGVSGRFGAAPRVQIEDLPNSSYLLEAVLHLGGPVARADGKLGWQIDMDDYEAALRIAADWCTNKGRSSEVIYRKALLKPSRLNPGEDPVSRLLGELDPFDRTQFWTRDGPEIRFVVTEPLYSRLAVIGFLDLADTDRNWRPRYDDLKNVVVTTGDLAAYSFIRHGIGNPSTSAGDNHWPWPPRPGWELSLNVTSLLQDDHLAQDAFAFQALGPGYEGKNLSFPSYRLERDGRMAFLEHRDLAAWFRDPFVPPGTNAVDLPSLPVPQVLAEARSELESLLIKPGDLGQEFHLDPGFL